MFSCMHGMCVLIVESWLLSVFISLKLEQNFLKIMLSWWPNEIIPKKKKLLLSSQDFSQQYISGVTAAILFVKKY